MILFVNRMMQIMLIVIFILFVVIAVKIIEDQNRAKNSKKEKQLKKKENMTDHEPADQNDQEIVQEAVCNDIKSLKIVINSKSEYEPEQLEEPFCFLGKLPNPQNDERHYLIIRKGVLEKLKKSLDWGERTRRNRVEQGGMLLGHIAYYHKEIYCFVEDILLADTAGSSAFVEFTNEMWAAMQNELAERNAGRNKNELLAIVGWFHTHPNKLPVFMSGTDMNTQRLNFSREWQASLVMNPHMNKYRVFFGAKAVEGKIVLPESSGRCRSVAR